MRDNELVEVPEDGDGWVLNAGPFLFHHAHLQEEAGSARKNCAVCQRDVEAFFSPVEVPQPLGDESAVDQSNRADEKGAAAPSRDNESPRGRDWYDW